MPNSFIQIVQTSPRGASILTAMFNYYIAKEALALILADFNQMTDGSDYTAIEAAFGIPTGKGQAVNALITNAIGEFNAAANANLLVNQLGVTR